MTDEEVKKIMEKWMFYELYNFILPYLLLYGEKYINDPLNKWQLIRQFEREWETKTEDEKDSRFKTFYKLLKSNED